MSLEGNTETVHVEKNVYVFAKIDEDSERAREKDLFMEASESTPKSTYHS